MLLAANMVAGYSVFVGELAEIGDRVPERFFIKGLFNPKATDLSSLQREDHPARNGDVIVIVPVAIPPGLSGVPGSQDVFHRGLDRPLQGQDISGENQQLTHGHRGYGMEVHGFVPISITEAPHLARPTAVCLGGDKVLGRFLEAGFKFGNIGIEVTVPCAGEGQDRKPCESDGLVLIVSGAASATAILALLNEIVAAPASIRMLMAIEPLKGCPHGALRRLAPAFANQGTLPGSFSVRPGSPAANADGVIDEGRLHVHVTLIQQVSTLGNINRRFLDLPLDYGDIGNDGLGYCDLPLHGLLLGRIVGNGRRSGPHRRGFSFLPLRNDHANQNE